MNQSRNVPIRRQSQSLPFLAMAFAFVSLSLFVPTGGFAEDLKGEGPGAEKTLVVVLEVESPGSAVRRYELATTTRSADTELNLGRTVPLEVLREGKREIQYQDVGVRFRAQVTHLEDGRYRLRGRIEDRHLVPAAVDGRPPEMTTVSQSVQAIVQPGVPLEVAAAEGRTHRLTLRFPTGSGVGAGQR